jgi:hypothetical protein
MENLGAPEGFGAVFQSDRHQVGQYPAIFHYSMSLCHLCHAHIRCVNVDSLGHWGHERRDFRISVSTSTMSTRKINV